MIELPDLIRQKIAAEFRFAANAIRTVSDLPRKIYFYSAFYGEINRSLNWWWSPDLALLHLVLQDSHRIIKGRIDAAVLGGEGAVDLPGAFPDIWAEIADDLAKLFEKADPIEEAELYTILARIAELSYSVTGNGYYLFLKGAIKLGEPSEPERPAARSRGGARRKASQP